MVDVLIQWDNDRQAKHPGVNFSISPPGGVAVSLQCANSSNLIDAAGEAEKD